MSNFDFDFGEVIVTVEDDCYDEREEAIEYIHDFMEDFVEFVEEKIPDIVDQFKEAYPARFSYWCKQGYVIMPRGEKYDEI